MECSGVGMPALINFLLHSSDLDGAAKSSPIAEIVGRVSMVCGFYMDQMFYKPAGKMFPSAWHQDTSYYNIEGDQVVRAVC